MGGFGMGGFGMGGFGMFSNCGLGSFYRQKKDLRWAKELFQQADDESWLKGLLEKSEIDSEQFEWLKDLFEKHHQQDVDGEANQWWSKHFEGKADDIDSESMPNWLQQHSQKEKDFNWSWNSEHQSDKKENLLKKWREAADAAKENLEQKKGKLPLPLKWLVYVLILYI